MTAALLARISVLTASALLATGGLARAQEEYQVLQTFAESRRPWSRMVRAIDGNFYGVTLDGIYRLTPAGVYMQITSFAFPALLSIAPFQASDGDLYVTEHFGLSGAERLFRVSLNGTVTVVHEGILQGYESLAAGDDGDFYGFTARDGDFGVGTAYRITPGGVLTTLRSLTPAEGPRCCTRLVKGTDGFFYGTTAGPGGGTIFRADTSGVTTTLHVFTDGPQGWSPQTELVEARDGNFYGTTSGGGAHGAGTIFRLQADGTVTVVYTFTGDGIVDTLRTPLIHASDGNLYGAGLNGIYRVTLDGEFRLVHSTAFSSPVDAARMRYGYGIAGLIEGPEGQIYGAARFGAPGASGALFRFNMNRSPCTNAFDLRQGILSGALKSETPAFMTALVVSTTEVTPLWNAVTPPVTPTFVFEHQLLNGGLVGVYSLVYTADGHVCADWTTDVMPAAQRNDAAPR